MEQGEIVARIAAWQVSEFVHPLTCGNDSSHALLVPMPEGPDVVVLRCLDCGYRQTHIPPMVLGGQDHETRPPTENKRR